MSVRYPSLDRHCDFRPLIRGEKAMNTERVLVVVLLQLPKRLGPT
jgi:hypothetical protein